MYDTLEVCLIALIIHHLLQILSSASYRCDVARMPILNKLSSRLARYLSLSSCGMEKEDKPRSRQVVSFTSSFL